MTGRASHSKMVSVDGDSFLLSLDVDLGKIIEAMGEKAIRNRNKKSRAMSGALVVRAEKIYFKESVG